MGLVDDERVVLGQHLSPASQVSAEEMKVHDDDVRGSRPRTGCLCEALARPTGSDEHRGIRRR